MEIKLSLSVDDVNKILRILAKEPFYEVHNLINDIDKQSLNQLEKGEQSE